MRWLLRLGTKAEGGRELLERLHVVAFIDESIIGRAALLWVGDILGERILVLHVITFGDERVVHLLYLIVIRHSALF